MNLSDATIKRATSTSYFSLLSKDVGLPNFKKCLAAFFRLYEPDKAKAASLADSVLVGDTVEQLEDLTAKQGYAHLLEPLYKVPKVQAQRTHKLDLATMLVSFKPTITPVEGVVAKRPGSLDIN